MSELEARERYYWSKIRQDLKAGHVEDAAGWFEVVSEKAPHLYRALEIKVAATFTAGCIALGDPAPLEKEQERICKNCRMWRLFSSEWNGCRPCDAECGAANALFFVGGGDNNDGLYTASTFGCVHFEARTKEQDNG